jgi:hypothetical protein
LGTKSTVEDSLVLSVRDVRKRLYGGGSGTVAWSFPSGGQSAIAYFVTWAGAAPVVTLCYQGRHGPSVRQPIRLQPTPTQFDGLRWWFTCPLFVSGASGAVCGRRAGKLYLPPCERYFGCRQCHNLTYRSAQEAHQTERLVSQLGFGPGVRRRLLASPRHRPAGPAGAPPAADPPG